MLETTKGEPVGGEYLRTSGCDTTGKGKEPGNPNRQKACDVDPV